MPTTIHLPAILLKKIDARAKALGMSRNRFIAETLAEKVEPVREWPEEFVRALKRPVDREISAAADEMLREIHASRRSRKRPPKLG